MISGLAGTTLSEEYRTVDEVPYDSVQWKGLRRYDVRNIIIPGPASNVQIVRQSNTVTFGYRLYFMLTVTVECRPLYGIAAVTTPVKIYFMIAVANKKIS